MAGPASSSPLAISTPPNLFPTASGERSTASPGRWAQTAVPRQQFEPADAPPSLGQQYDHRRILHVCLTALSDSEETREKARKSVALKREGSPCDRPDEYSGSVGSVAHAPSPPARWSCLRSLRRRHRSTVACARRPQAPAGA